MFKKALGEVRGIKRYGTGFAPLDEVRPSFDQVVHDDSRLMSPYLKPKGIVQGGDRHLLSSVLLYGPWTQTRKNRGPLNRDAPPRLLLVRHGVRGDTPRRCPPWRERSPQVCPKPWYSRLLGEMASHHIQSRVCLQSPRPGYPSGHREDRRGRCPKHKRRSLTRHNRRRNHNLD